MIMYLGQDEYAVICVTASLRYMSQVVIVPHLMKWCPHWNSLDTGQDKLDNKCGVYLDNSLKPSTKGRPGK